MTAKTLPDQEYLRECFDYDPDTGLLIWKHRPRRHHASDGEYKRWNRRWIGEIAGSPAPPKGYLNVGLFGSLWKVHRIIWKMQTGDEPNKIDHANCITTDNSWNNLRAAPGYANSWNRKKRRGAQWPKGVTQQAWNGRYQAQVQVNKRRICLGTYDTPEEAHAAYCKAAQEHFGEFWNPG